MRAEFGIVREAVLALHDAGRRWLAGGAPGGEEYALPRVTLS